MRINNNNLNRVVHVFHINVRTEKNAVSRARDGASKPTGRGEEKKKHKKNESTSILLHENFFLLFRFIVVGHIVVETRRSISLLTVSRCCHLQSQDLIVPDKKCAHIEVTNMTT